MVSCITCWNCMILLRCLPITMQYFNAMPFQTDVSDLESGWKELEQWCTQNIWKQVSESCHKDILCRKYLTYETYHVTFCFTHISQIDVLTYGKVCSYFDVLCCVAVWSSLLHAESLSVAELQLRWPGEYFCNYACAELFSSSLLQADLMQNSTLLQKCYEST